ncbi:MAG: hypothetical protein WA432_03855 [Candidatus Babeliaceae bacterium]
MKYFLILLFAITCLSIVHAQDNAHFWRPPLFIYEPRFEKNKLTTLEISLFGGNTRTSRNSCGNKVPLFDLWGPQQVQHLGQNLPLINTDNTLDQILINLNQLPPSQGFATLSISGMFDLFEMFIDFYQNIINGFFIHFQVPVRVMAIENIAYDDFSPVIGISNKNTPTWQLFLANFKNILHQFKVSDQPVHISATGDSTLLLGWAQNYENTEYLDFIDTTIELGCLFPTGHKKNPHLLFDIASGYDGHWGMCVDWRGAIGLYDWLTLGAFMNGLFFFNRTKTKLVTTAGTSIIKLAQICVREKKGTLWLPGLYIKADHFVDGLSVLLGYSYAKKDHDYLVSCDSLFPNNLINNDQSLIGFKLHTLHGILSYDFSKDYRPYGPRIALFLNIPLHGKRVFDILMGGATLGFDCAWDF